MSTDQVLDRIERETTIAAPQSRVWELITEPGWWINSGTITTHDVDTDHPGCVVVHDSDHGDFAVAIIAQQPFEYAAFRWYSGPSMDRRTADLTDGASTLVEFFVAAVDTVTTRLRVVESGFAQLDEDSLQ